LIREKQTTEISIMSIIEHQKLRSMRNEDHQEHAERAWADPPESIKNQ
jgi:hypothetical protein